MLKSNAGPLPTRALVIDDGLAKLDTALGRAAEGLAASLEARNVEVVRAFSFEDARAIVGFDASLRAVLLNWNLGADGASTHAQATALLHKLRERHANVPVFLVADRELAKGSISLEVAEHLSPGRAESFISDLCQAAPVVLFGAAIPGQGGVGHLNEQWQSYWANLFEACGSGNAADPLGSSPQTW